MQPGILERQLDGVIQADVATTREEMTLGACSIAVPVRRGRCVVAALGVVVPSLRERDKLVTAIQVAARGVGRRLDSLSAGDLGAAAP